jgi:hypothetical protein
MTRLTGRDTEPSAVLGKVDHYLRVELQVQAELVLEGLEEEGRLSVVLLVLNREKSFKVYVFLC